jgi:hypothetical protein
MLVACITHVRYRVGVTIIAFIVWLWGKSFLSNMVEYNDWINVVIKLVIFIGQWWLFVFIGSADSIFIKKDRVSFSSSG